MAAKKAVSTNKNERQRLEDFIFYQILTVFSFSIIYEIFFFLLYRLYYRGITAVPILTALAVLSFAGVCAGTFLLLRNRKNSAFSVKGLYLFSLSVLSLFFCLLIIFKNITAIKLLCVFCPIVAILHLIQLTYPPEFFCIASLCSAGIFVIVFSSRYCMNLRSLILILTVAAAACFCIFLGISAKKHSGIAPLFNGRRFFSASSSQTLFFIGCVLVLLALFMALLSSFVLSMPAIIILSVLLFVFAIYHTVGLM